LKAAAPRQHPRRWDFLHLAKEHRHDAPLCCRLHDPCHDQRRGKAAIGDDKRARHPKTPAKIGEFDNLPAPKRIWVGKIQSPDCCNR